mmetsp:Transcript_39517/g.93012  ORF Transcript_39517/g.93012 Transcript_39517/m.93012 type:complete len:210 (-) Transcript_39517:348-977(-)
MPPSSAMSFLVVSSCARSPTVLTPSFSASLSVSPFTAWMMQASTPFSAAILSLVALSFAMACNATSAMHCTPPSPPSDLCARMLCSTARTPPPSTSLALHASLSAIFPSVLHPSLCTSTLSLSVCIPSTTTLMAPAATSCGATCWSRARFPNEAIPSVCTARSALCFCMPRTIACTPPSATIWALAAFLRSASRPKILNPCVCTSALLL